MTDNPLTIKDLSFRYWRREEDALRNIDFSLEPGQVMLIAGSSGCGKTTLMRCINGLIPHTYKGEMTGEITLFGRSVNGMGLADISQTVGTFFRTLNVRSWAVM